MAERYRMMLSWLEQRSGIRIETLEPASNDASFRRYFRVEEGACTRIVMDAPPDREDCRPFVDIAARLVNAGLNVPEIISEDLDKGLLLLTDLGKRSYLEMLNDESVDELYAAAIRALLRMQVEGDIGGLPPYDEVLLRQEMELFPEWLVNRHLGFALDKSSRRALQRGFDFLTASALSQPRTFVHRDYHSRNLMYVSGNNPGVLDFQDAVTGPVTYDLVSLLRDCYVRWPRKQVEKWALDYYVLAKEARLLADTDENTFLRWFDLMGVQRHLKASGIFARLYHRDDRSGYLPDIPRTLEYILDATERYAELEELNMLIKKTIFPEFKLRGLP